MKKYFFLLLCTVIFTAIANETIFTDNFKRSQWRTPNTQNWANVADNTLILDDDKLYIRYAGGEHPFGAKYSFSLENIENGEFKLGFYVYIAGNKVSQYFSEKLTHKGEFTLELPESVRNIGIIIQGKGKYRNAKLIRIVDPAYKLTADPIYQMTSEEPQPVTFILYHNEKEVPNADIRKNGLDAVHPPSGATTSAYIVKADTAAFDAAAKNIKLTKPVSVLYLGDSLTHFDLGFNHVDKFDYFLNKHNPGKAELWNYACGGDDIQRIVQRLNNNGTGRWKNRYQDIWSRNYDWAFILLGHNDTKASSAKNYTEPVITPAQQLKSYEILIAKLKEKDIKRIILVSSTSSNFDLCRANAEKNKRVHNRFGDPKHQENFNTVLQELAQKHSLEYLDVYTPMKALPDKADLLNPRDGVHLTPAGHDFIALETLKYLEKTQ